MPGRVLVTGGQGLLGRSLVSALLADGCEAVLGVGRSPRTDDTFTHTLRWLGRDHPAPLPPPLRVDDPRYAYQQLDVRDAAAVRETVGRFRPDVVIHAAASLRGEGLDALLESNIRATYGLVSGCGGRVVIVSSGSVYGSGAERLPLREDGVTQPVELYGISKRTAEDIANALGSDVVVARVFNLVGAGLQDRHLPAYVAGQVAAIARGLAPPVISLGRLDTTRDYVDVTDAARAIVTLTTAPAGTYNVASGIETPVQSVVDQLLAGAGRPVRVEPVPTRSADISRVVADVSRLAALGFRPSTPLSGTLADMLSYFGDFPGG